MDRLQVLLQGVTLNLVALVLVAGFVYQEVIEDDDVSGEYTALTLGVLALYGVGRAAPAAIAAARGEQPPGMRTDVGTLNLIADFDELTEEVGAHTARLDNRIEQLEPLMDLLPLAREALGLQHLRDSIMATANIPRPRDDEELGPPPTS